MSPEPVGSTHLRFGDARVVEILVCGNPKVVRSPGCDHGHDEEYRYGRDIKINILEAYIWISEVFRVKSGFKHRLPIYQSLCLDHFETPRHVRDHIWDSEQPSVHQNA